MICTVSVQYLQYPERVFAEIYRVLKPGGICIISFSSRLFYQKAIQAWRDNSAFGRINLVKQYFSCVPGKFEALLLVDLGWQHPILRQSTLLQGSLSLKSSEKLQMLHH